MNNELQNQFNKLEKLTDELIRGVESTTTDQLHYNPPDKWSLSQVFAHLIASEQLSIQYLKKKTLAIEEQPDTGFTEELKMLVLIISQRLPFKFKAPKVVTDHTPAFNNLAEIVTTWNQTRAELKELLNGISADHLKRKIYKHPVAGKLNIRQTLRFFREHLIHHTPQIKRLLKDK